jgi:intein/homing endonuclease
MELYKPFVVAKLKTQFGYEMPDAIKAMQKMEPHAIKALEATMNERPLILKRDPVLHKFGVMAFRPILFEGKAIRIHPLVCGSFNADFDGDQMLGSVFLNLINGLDNFLQTCKDSVSVAWASKDWWLARHAGEGMAARFKERVGFAVGGDLFIVNLEDFPHEGSPIVKDHIEFFQVPKGISVISYDETYGRLVLAEVSNWSRHKDRKVEIVNLASGRQIVSDDDPRAVYGIDRDLEFVRARPKDAIGMFVPVAHTVDFSNGSYPELLPIPLGDARTKQAATLNCGFGRLLGTLVGDGWVVTSGGQLKGQVALAAAEISIRDGFERDLLEVFQDPPVITSYERVGGDFGDDVLSRRYVVSSMAFSKLVDPLIGKGAGEKHLPPFFLSAPRDFRLGLLAGLIDTDGSISISNGKAKPQWMISFATKSIRLAQEITYLSKSLELRASITACKTPGGEPMWAVAFSTVDFHKLQELPLSDANKVALFKQFFSEPSPAEKNSYSQKDVIPTPPKLAKWLRQQVGTELGQSIYVVLSNAMDRGYISRYTAREILEKRPDLQKEAYLARWVWLVENTHVWWDRVVDFEVTEQTETGFDLTVPGFETFMSVDGIVLSNTMAGSVPISSQAVAEARKMFPSKNLFSSTNYEPLYRPTQESLLGLYLLSKWGKHTGTHVKDYEALRHLVEIGKVGHTDVVKVDSVGAKPTTFGRLWMAKELPSSLSTRDKLIHDPTLELSSKPLMAMVEHIAKEHPESFDKSINHLKDLGNDFSYKSGFSFGLKDFATLKERDHIIAVADKKAATAKHIKDPAKREAAIIAAYSKATEDIDTAARNKSKDGTNRLFTMVYSGARGKPEQLRQMIAAPMLMQDHAGRTIPTPVTHNYSEGLDVGDYWLSQHGARKGILQRNRGSSKPGELTKDIINSAISTLIVADDCGTKHGINLPIKNHKDIDTRDVADRYLAHDIKLQDGTTLKAGTLLKPHHIDKIRLVSSNIPVRSPLKCEQPQGICAKCYGINENGKLHQAGTNIGVIAGQAMGEPATQLALDSFHSGGLASGRGGASISRIERLQQLLKMPDKIKGQATLAKVTGRVTSIKPNKAIGGHDVVIEGHTHRVDSLDPALKVGATIERGGSLSEAGSPINPQQFLNITKDIHKVRKLLTDELHGGLYQKEGVRQRNIETVVKALTNLTRVKDPGSSHWDIWDVAPHSAVEAYNRSIHGTTHKPVVHESVLFGSEQIPNKAQDWMSRLNYRNIKSTIQQAAATRLKSDIHGMSPIPGIAHGKEFGLPPKGKKQYLY